MRVAVSGYGYWGSRHARLLSQQDDVHLIVVDTNSEQLEQAQKDIDRVETFTVANAPWSSFDAVVIATPPKFHLPIATLALDGGAHVFVEKPLAPSSSGALELVNRAAELNKIVMVGHTYDYHAVVNSMIDMVLDGQLGEIRHINAIRTNLGLHRRDVNVMWDLAPHDIGIILRMCGETPETVACWQSDTSQSGVVDLADLRMQFSTGVEACVRSSWIDTDRVRKITVTGTTATLSYDETDFENPIRIFPRELEPIPEPSAAFNLEWTHPMETTAKPLEQPEPLRVEMEHFLECARENKTPRTTGQDGLNVVRLLEICDKSARLKGEPLPVTPAGFSRPVPATLPEVSSNAASKQSVPAAAS